MLVDTYGGLIKSIVSFHLSEFSQYRDECINDILLSIWQNMKSFDENKNSLKNWIGAISKYKSIDYIRKHYKDLSFDELDESIPDSRSNFETEISDEIQSLLSSLKEEDRSIFYKYYILGEKVNEIARDTQKSPAYLFNRLSRGRKKLRKTFKGVV